MSSSLPPFLPNNSVVPVRPLRPTLAYGNALDFHGAVVVQAMTLDYIRETEPNAGPRVFGLQLWGGGSMRDNWCAEFVSVVFDMVFGGYSPFGLTTACEEYRAIARAKGWLTDDATKVKAGDLILSIDPTTKLAHHIAIAVDALLPQFNDGAASITAVAGNTSPDGLSTNGTGVFYHPVPLTNKEFIVWSEPTA